MSMIVQEYTVVRIYVLGAKPIQVYFQKEDTCYTGRLEQIADAEHDGNKSRAAREILQRVLKVSKMKLAERIRKECEKRDLKVSGFVRKILIGELTRLVNGR